MNDLITDLEIIRDKIESLRASLTKTDKNAREIQDELWIAQEKIKNAIRHAKTT